MVDDDDFFPGTPGAPGAACEQLARREYDWTAPAETEELSATELAQAVAVLAVLTMDEVDAGTPWLH